MKEHPVIHGGHMCHVGKNGECEKRVCGERENICETLACRYAASSSSRVSSAPPALSGNGMPRSARARPSCGVVSCKIPSSLRAVRSSSAASAAAAFPSIRGPAPPPPAASSCPRPRSTCCRCAARRKMAATLPTGDCVAPSACWKSADRRRLSGRGGWNSNAEPPLSLPSSSCLSEGVSEKEMKRSGALGQMSARGLDGSPWRLVERGGVRYGGSGELSTEELSPKLSAELDALSSAAAYREGWGCRGGV